MWHLAYDQIVKENNIREKIKRSKLWTYLKYERYVYLYAKKICSVKEISMGEREFLINFEKAYNLTDIIYLRTTGLERVEILNRRSKTGKDHQLWENIYCYKKLNIKEGQTLHFDGKLKLTIEFNIEIYIEKVDLIIRENHLIVKTTELNET